MSRLNISKEQALREHEAILAASRAVFAASQAIGNRMIVDACGPGSAELAQVSDWQARLQEMSAGLRQLLVESAVNIPRNDKPFAERKVTGLLGATYTGD